MIRSILLMQHSMSHDLFTIGVNGKTQGGWMILNTTVKMSFCNALCWLRAGSMTVEYLHLVQLLHKKTVFAKLHKKKIHYCCKSYTIHSDSSFIQWLLPTGKKKTASVKRWKVLDPLCQVLIFLSYFVHHCYLNLAISLEEHWSIDRIMHVYNKIMMEILMYRSGSDILLTICTCYTGKLYKIE